MPLTTVTSTWKTQQSLSDMALAKLHRHVAAWDIMSGSVNPFNPTSPDSVYSHANLRHGD